MSIRVIPDENQPYASIEIPLEKPLPDYDLERMAQPTPRDVDAILVSQGFRDLVDDARGILMDLLSHPPVPAGSPDLAHLDFTPAPQAFELVQLTGAICPGNDEIYRPGMWIVVRDTHAKPKTTLHAAAQERVAAIARELVKRLQLE